MPHLDALPIHSEINVLIGAPKHDRRLSDKILAAFSHATAEGAPAGAALLHRALEEAERDIDGGGINGARAGRCFRPTSGSNLPKPETHSSATSMPRHPTPQRSSAVASK